MKSILDFFLLMDISFYSTQLSQTSSAVSRLLIARPAILVSSANNYGCRLISFKIISVKSLVKILNSKHEMPHPCPSPLPICMFPISDWMTKLLNISYTPWIVFSWMFKRLIFSNKRLWLTTSYALAKSIKSIHTVLFLICGFILQLLDCSQESIHI